MAIFGHQYGLYPISRQRTGIMLRCMFRWKAVVISFSKIQYWPVKSSPGAIGPGWPQDGPDGRGSAPMAPNGPGTAPYGP